MLYLPVILNNYVEYSWRSYGIHASMVAVACNGIASPLIYVWQSETLRRQICIMYGLKKVIQEDEEVLTQ